MPLRLPPVPSLAVAAAVVALGACAPQAEEAPKAQGAPQETPEAVTTLEALPEDTNAVQQEMRLLDVAMGAILTHIANDALQGIPEHIKRLHPAKVLTTKALEQGVYAPPGRPDDVEGFVAKDEVFHDDLRALLKAAKQDDLEAATDAYSKLVQGCTDCHTAYRFPGGRASQQP